MADPQKPAPPAPLPPELPFETLPSDKPWSRQVAEQLGIAPALDATQAAVDNAGRWFRSHLLGMSPEDQAHFLTLGSDATTKVAEEKARQQAAWDALKKRVGSSAPAQRLGPVLAEQYGPSVTPSAQTNAVAEVLRQGITEKSDALRAALPKAPTEVDWGALAPGFAKARTGDPLDKGRSTVDPLKPIDWMVGAQHDWIPNTLVDIGEQSATPAGALMNFGDVGPVLHGAGALAAKLGVGAASMAGVLPPGFFSRVGKIAEAVSAKGIHPNKLLSLLKSGASAEEVAYRGLPEFIASKGNALITRDELAAHLAAHPPPQIGRTILGEHANSYEAFIDQMEQKYGVGYDTAALTPEEQAEQGQLWWKANTQTGGMTAGRPKYGSHTLPGGENYRESLTTLQGPAEQLAALNQRRNDLARALTLTDVSREEHARYAAEYRSVAQQVRALEAQGPPPPSYTSSHFDEPNILVHARTNERFLPAQGLRSFDEVEAIIQQAVGAKSASSLASGAPEVALRKGLISSEEAALYGNAKGFTNYPHPPGARGRFLEEVQSDWNQQGKRQGYRQPPDPADAARLSSLNGEIELARRQVADINLASRAASDAYLTALGGQTRARLPPEYAHITSFNHALDAAARGDRGAVEAWRAARDVVHRDPTIVALREAEQAHEPHLRAAIDRVTVLQNAQRELYDKTAKGVPDNPFKETWPDLALKQQLLDVAHRQDLSWLGFTSGKTQAARYDLAKQVSRLEYDPIDRRLLAYDHYGQLVLEEATEPEGLADLIGKEPADKLSQKIHAHEQSREYARAQWSTEIDPESGQFLIVDPNGEVMHDHGGTPLLHETEREAHQHIDDLVNNEYDNHSQPRPRLEGLDLQVGGEGMTSFYDQLLPRRLEKLVKPFGGTVEKGSVPITKEGIESVPGFSVEDNWGHVRGWWPTRAEAEAYIDSPPANMTSYVSREGGSAVIRAAGTKATDTVVDEPAWIAHLSPEMKERIRKQGFPLMSVLPPALLAGGAAAAASQLGGDDPDHPGSAAALGMAAALPFIPGMRRPGLTKASRAMVEEARLYLQNAGLRGPIAKDELAEILQEAPLWGHAHRVTKDLPVEPPLKRASKILMPGERGFDFSPGAETRLHGMADIGAALPHQANWGGATDPAMAAAFHHDPQSAELFGRFFSALSPRTSVPKNSLEALQVWDQFLRHPKRPFTDARMHALGVGNVRSKTDNVMRAILGEDPSGEKVDLFTDYMIGRAKLPVPDVHGLYAMGSAKTAIDDMIPELRRLVQKFEGIPAVRGGLTNKDYVRRLVDAFGRSLQTYDPAEPMGPLFGSTWEGTRAQKGLPFQGGMIDIYKSRGLTEPGAMFDLPALTQAIRDWSKR